MNQYLVTALFDAVLATIAVRKKDNPSAKALAFTLYSCALWSLELFFLSSLSQGVLLNVLFHVTRVGMFFIPSCFALLTWRINHSRSKRFLNLVVIPGLLFSLALGLINLFVFPTQLLPTQSGFLPEVDAIYFGFIACFVWCKMNSIGFSIYCYRRSTHRERQKIKWLLITLAVVFVGGLTSLLFMPQDFYLARYMGSILNLVFVALLFYSTIQHRLMDFRLAISVGLSKALLLGFVVWLIFLANSFFGSLDASPGGALAFILLIILSLEFYPKVLQWLLPNTKKFLTGDRYDFDDLRREMQAALNGCVSLKGVFSVLDYYLIQKIKVSNYAIILTVASNENQFANMADRRMRDRAIYLDKKDLFFTYMSESKNLLMIDEAPDMIQARFREHNAQLGFSVWFQSRCKSVILVGALKEDSFYRYDDIRIFEWLQREMGQVFNRIAQIDEMQNQLAQAKKTLSMLGVMNHYHHDIKAPLAIIDGVLSNNIYDKEKQKDIVLEQVERGSRLIATMAAILKGERKRNIQAVDFQDIVQDSLFLFSKGIDAVRYNFLSTTQIMADAEDLKILVINVVKNAMEARRDNAPLELIVSTWESADCVYLSFADTGSGMSESQLASLWDESTSSKARGNGIGLQAIKRIADEHMAEIEVLSELGKGTEFIFKFPITLAVRNDELSRDAVRDASRDENQAATFLDHKRKPMAG